MGTPATKVLKALRISLTVRLVNHGGGYPRWTDVSNQYLNSLFRGFAISFGRDPSVSSLTIPTVIHNLINQSINQPIGIQSSQVPTGLGQRCWRPVPVYELWLEC